MDYTRRIFVFGSNLAGIHGRGSARHAVEHHGAEYGVGHGLTGNAYAIPTKKNPRVTLSIAEISEYVRLFKAFAHSHPLWQFDVVKVGCGLAGYTESQIEPLFRGSPENVILPEGWGSIAPREPGVGTTPHTYRNDTA